MSFLDLIAVQNLEHSGLIKIFLDCEKQKNEGTIYLMDDYIPQDLIKWYFKSGGINDFSKIIYNFKRKYLCNQNESESAHDKEEHDGISVVYDYISEATTDICPNIFVILRLHALLYSKVPYPEFGGRFRTESACISDSDVKTTPPEQISSSIAALYSEYDQILKLSEIIKETQSAELLMQYIDRAIEIKSRLIEIHPFEDGNGRTCRALVNLLFRKINLPPIYVKKIRKERIY